MLTAEAEKRVKQMFDTLEQLMSNTRRDVLELSNRVKALEEMFVASVRKGLEELGKDVAPTPAKNQSEVKK